MEMISECGGRGQLGEEEGEWGGQLQKGGWGWGGTSSSYLLRESKIVYIGYCNKN